MEVSFLRGRLARFIVQPASTGAASQLAAFDPLYRVMQISTRATLIRPLLERYPRVHISRLMS
jgi:hypothetical protein